MSHVPSEGRPAGRPSRGLWPREHGAYGQLGMPLLTALLLGIPSIASLGLVVATVAGFLLHEPVLLLLGARGSRAKRELGPRAKRRVMWLAGAALVAGSISLALSDHPVWLACLVPLGSLVVLSPFVLLGREKTTLGELVAALALSTAGLPVAVSAGVSWSRAALVFSVWWVALAASTVSVRAVISRGRGQPVGWGSWVIYPLMVLSTVWITRHSWIGLGAAPMVSVSAYLLLRPPHPRRLRTVGWTLMAASGLTTALLVTLGRVVA